MQVTLENLDEVFTYHTPTSQQQSDYEAIRYQAKILAMVILARCPNCADQQAALRLVRESVMTANAAIALKHSSERL